MNLSAEFLNMLGIVTDNVMDEKTKEKLNSVMTKIDGKESKLLSQEIYEDIRDVVARTESSDEKVEKETVEIYHKIYQLVLNTLNESTSKEIGNIKVNTNL